MDAAFKRRWLFMIALFAFAMGARIIAYANAPGATNLLITVDMIAVFAAGFLGTSAFATALELRDEQAS